MDTTEDLAAGAMEVGIVHGVDRLWVQVEATGWDLA
jgi:hypothetical protein